MTPATPPGPRADARLSDIEQDHLELKRAVAELQRQVQFLLAFKLRAEDRFAAGATTLHRHGAEIAGLRKRAGP